MSRPDPFGLDRPVDRTGTDSVKWERYAGRDVLPLWVADTDFRSPPAVIRALHDRVDHGVFGYTLPPPELTTAVQTFLDDTFGWIVEPDWLIWLPGLVSGIAVCCRAFAGPGEGVLTSVPIYPPFLTAPRATERLAQTAPLMRGPERWEFDWEAFHAACDERTRVYLFCSPHNPCGRIWERAELEQLADACAREDLVIVSDEIHNQLLLDHRPHVPTACLAPEVAARTVTLMAPSKTYNIAGLGCSYAIIPDPSLRRRFERAMAMIVPHPTALSYPAALAAYRDGGAWLDAQLDHLRRGRDRLEEAVAAMAGVSMTHVEATYLAWLDVRDLVLADPAAHFEAHGLGLQDGRPFGAPGFLRWNFGTTHGRLRLALERFAAGCAAAR